MSSSRLRRACLAALVATIPLLAVVTTPEPAEARYATGGSGSYRGAIDWFEWGTVGEVIPREGTTRVNTREVAGGTLATTCTLSNLVDPAPAGINRLSVYRPGGWGGDGLDDMYNIGGTGNSNQLVSGLRTGGTTVSFDFACSVTLNGNPVPLAGLVMADAEQSTSEEYVQATIPASADWRLIDRTRTPNCQYGGRAIRTGQTLRFSGLTGLCPSGPTAVAFMEGATSAKVEMRGGGASAIALGVMVFNDFGDAPSTYGDAGALYSPGFEGAPVPQGTHGIFDLALSTPGQPTTRLGATVDSEPASQSNPQANGDGADDNAIGALGTVRVTPGTTYTVPNVACAGPGVVAGWIDWNGDGTFGAGERSDAVPCTGSSVSLSFDIPDDVASGTTYLRLRIAGDAAGVAAPTGVTTSGEVEDHALVVLPRGDFADAPDTFDTLRASGGAVHLVPGLAGGVAPLMIGATVDIEDDGVPGASASGDDTTASDDEDGVTEPIVATTGTPFEVDVDVTNAGTADATLAGWVDLDGDGVFEAAERSLVTVPAGTTADTFGLAFPAPTTTAATYARFRLFPGAVTDPQPVGQAAAGEVEDHPVSVLVPELEITKESNAGASSVPGDTVEYTVTLSNTGDGAFTTANPARLVDDLTGVLDDADFNDDAAASVGDDPVFTEPRLRWSGPLEPGDDVVITYSVDLTGGGDGSATNVAFGPPTGDEIPTPVCGDSATTVPCATTTANLPKLEVEKSADTTELPAVGDTVNYTIIVRNTGPGDYTADYPATFTDDLSDVLDDADFNGTPTASSGEVTRVGDTLSWEGELASGDEATIEYSVTYDPAGPDPRLVNTACVPVGEATDVDRPCDTASVPGANLTQTKTATPDDGTVLEAGSAITYTLTFANDGSIPATVDTIDDLSGVLDDADVTVEPVVEAGATLTAVRTGDQLAITGTVAPDDSVTVTYTVVVRDHAQQGDHVVANSLACQPGESSACEPETTTHPVRHLTLTKTSDAVAGVDTGDTVNYTVTLTNDGGSDFTAGDPAEVVDDLSDVLDDARIGTITSTSGTARVEGSDLVWDGPLAAGTPVTITYPVTVTNLGNHVLENVASVPDCTDLSCNPSAVVTELPHVVPSKTSDPVDGTDVTEGQVVTYTLSWTNDGPAPGVLDSSDDLSDVLDDAQVTTGPSSSDPDVTATIADGTLRVEGVIDDGQTITVSYQVTVLPDGSRGNNVLENVLTPDTAQVVCVPTGPCVPVAPPSTSHLIGELDDVKTVDPASGTSVVAGQEVTYTLTFQNTGTADVAVDREDVLSGVLDDAELTDGPTASNPALTVTDVTDGRIRVSGTLVPDQIVTVSYTVVVLDVDERTDSVLGNVLLDTGADPAGACALPGADCTANPVSDVRVVKSVDPADGSTVDPGDQLTYTLTFTNEAPGAGTLNHVDDLTDVVDDASVVDGPTTSSGAVTATAGASEIAIGGTIAPGATETVSYTVQVNGRDRLGNGTLANFVGLVGEARAATCDDDDPTCTTNSVSPAPPSPAGVLPETGATAGLATIIAGLVLTLSGLVLVRRRREA